MTRTARVHAPHACPPAPVRRGSAPARTARGAARWPHPGVVLRLRSRRGSAPARTPAAYRPPSRSEEHTSELQSLTNLVCRLLLEKKNNRREILKNEDEALAENSPYA